MNHTNETIYFISVHSLLQSMIEDAFKLIQYRVETPANLESAFRRIEANTWQHIYPAAIILDLSLQERRRELAFLLHCQCLLRYAPTQTATVILADPLLQVDASEVSVHYLFHKPFPIQTLLGLFSALPLQKKTLQRTFLTDETS